MFERAVAGGKRLHLHRKKIIDYAPWTVSRQRPRRLLRSLERRGRSSPTAPTGPDPDRCLTTGFSGPTGLGDFRGIRR